MSSEDSEKAATSDRGAAAEADRGSPAASQKNSNLGVTIVIGGVIAFVIGGALPSWEPWFATPAAAVLCPSSADFTTESRSWATGSAETGSNWHIACDGIEADEQPSELVSAGVSTVIMLPLGLLVSFGLRAAARWGNE